MKSFSAFLLASAFLAILVSSCRTSSNASGVMERSFVNNTMTERKDSVATAYIKKDSSFATDIGERATLNLSADSSGYEEKEIERIVETIDTAGGSTRTVLRIVSRKGQRCFVGSSVEHAAQNDTYARTTTESGDSFACNRLEQQGTEVQRIDSMFQTSERSGGSSVSWWQAFKNELLDCVVGAVLAVIAVFVVVRKSK